ncbi:hypothetical protein HMI54_007365 [Coelomomyces lativittatus]|nr:hypothetical protein HMI54_007365 [Coelomomyces lativittatus]KAJ1511232.1 hypothetical protein HMI56_005659 [Coelomomyces lativittatus]KAJ1517501.1 hypothetical protein HMI55_006887 [Coelomomyces lativittatus]
MTRKINYVQVGRVVLINNGKNTGKLAVIVDIIDHNRAILDGPTTDVRRFSCSYKCMTLTPILVKKVPRSASTEVLSKILADKDIKAIWNESRPAKRLAKRQIRQSLTDFDRFKVYRLKKRATAERKNAMTASRK